MKTTKFRTNFAIMSLAVALCATGCKNNATQAPGSVSDADVANTMAASMGSSTNGMASQAESSANIATTGKMGIAGKNGSQIQSAAQDTTVTLSGSDTVNGGTSIYNYTFSAHSLFHLTDGSTSPIWVSLATTTADLTLAMNGTYETPTYTGNDNVTASWSVGNILAVTPLTLSGTYGRNGKITGKAQGNSFSYNNSLTLSSLQIARVTRKITGGSATATVTGSLMNSSGQAVADYDFGGLITFLGNDQAQLVLTNNKTGVKTTFLIDLKASTASKA